jgi:hypothetical protein
MPSVQFEELLGDTLSSRSRVEQRGQQAKGIVAFFVVAPKHSPTKPFRISDEKLTLCVKGNPLDSP